MTPKGSRSRPGGRATRAGFAADAVPAGGDGGAASSVKVNKDRLVHGAAALSKGLELLDIIANQPTPPRFQTLARETGFSKATLHRMLAALMEHKLIRADRQTGTYHLGMHLLQLAHRVWDELDIRTSAIPVLERLSAQFNETASLVELNGLAAIHVEQRVGSSPLAFRSDAGSSEPLHASAAGKVILAHAPTQFREQYLGAPTLRRYTEKTIIDPDRLRSELSLVRARGYSVSDEEMDIGLRGVAAAILNPQNEAVGAICVSGPKDRMKDDRLHSIGSDVMAAAREVSGMVGLSPMSLSPSRPRRVETASSINSITPASDYLGEGPYWSEREQRLYWLDILAPSVHRFSPESGRHETCHLPEMISAVAETSDGMVALTQNGLQAFAFDTATLHPIVDPEANLPNNRFNDGKVDAAGRLWGGTMSIDAAAPTGALYTFGRNGRWACKDRGFHVSNGLDWNPDNTRMYFCDTNAGIIYQYDFDLSSGSVENRREFVRTPIDQGKPDGLTVDAEGTLWCAFWDGWCVRRFAPDGKLIQQLDLPVPRPSSCVFGGVDRETLYITTARIRLTESVLREAPLSGRVLVHHPGVRGKRSTLYEI